MNPRGKPLLDEAFPKGRLHTALCCGLPLCTCLPGAGIYLVPCPRSAECVSCSHPSTPSDAFLPAKLGVGGAGDSSTRASALCWSGWETKDTWYCQDTQQGLPRKPPLHHTHFRSEHFKVSRMENP